MSVFTEEYKRKHLRIHSQLRRLYGRATTCVADDCKKTSNRFCWAKIVGRRYTINPNDYKHLCSKCHYIYDSTNRENLTIDDIDDVILPNDFKEIKVKDSVKPKIIETFKNDIFIKQSYVTILFINDIRYAFVKIPKEAIDIHISNNYGNRFCMFYNLLNSDGYGIDLYYKYFGGKDNYPKDMQIVCHLSNPTNEIMSIFSENKLNLNDYENYILLKTIN